MKLLKSGILTVIFCIVSALLSYSQTQPNLLNGMPPLGSYDASTADTVNLVNGNLTIHIPLPFDYPQRGKLGVKYYLVINSKTWEAEGDPSTMTGQWYPTSAGCGSNSSGPCGQANLFVSTASFGMTRVWTKEWPDGQFPSYSATVPDTLITWDGSVHDLPGITTDTSGYSIQTSGDDGTGVYTTATLIDRNGTQYIGEFPTGGLGQCSVDNGNGLPGSTQTTTCIQQWGLDKVVDANGNVLSFPVPVGNIDTTGQFGFGAAHLATGTESSGCITSFGTPWIYYFSYPAPNGQTNQVKLCFAPYPQLSTGFSQSGVHQFQDSYSGHPFPGPWRAPVYLTNVILPDNTQWSMSYDSYGEVTSLSTPTGASIQYGWGEGIFPRCNIAGNDITKVSRAVLSRTVTDANGRTFISNYQWTPLAADGTLTHTVTDSSGNDAAHVFVDLTAGDITPICDFRETRMTSYQGTGGSRKPLQQVDTTWLHNRQTPGVPTDVKTTMLTSQKVSLVHTDYDSHAPILGLVTSTKTYDWGLGSPGPLLLEEDTVYQWQKDSRYFAANMLDLPATTVVVSPVAAMNAKTNCPVDAVGTVKSCMAQTDYSYDEANYLVNYENTVGILPSGSHIAAPNSIRGNATTSTKWLSTGGTIAAHTTWYDTGMVNIAADPGGHAATFSYDLAYAGKLPTKTCNAKGQCVSGTYDLNTGLLMSFTDVNGGYQASGTTPGDAAHTTSYTYDLMRRMKTVVLPADIHGNRPQSQFNYPDAATIQELRAVTASLTDTQTTHLDGLSHISRIEHSVPGGTVLLDMTYDGAGHKTSVTNPYFTTSDPTYGITYHQYDELGQTIQTTKQDGSIRTIERSIPTTTAVNGDCSIATDEAGKQRRTCTDALGRLVEVDEPNPGAQAVPAQGTLTINGTLKTQSGVGATGATTASGQVSIGGSDAGFYTPPQQVGGCDDTGFCQPIETIPGYWTCDMGTVHIVVNGHDYAYNFGGDPNGCDSTGSVAQGLVSAIMADGARVVNASVGSTGSNVVLTAIIAGSAGNNISFTSSATSDFTTTPASSHLSGGADSNGGAIVTDYGTVSVTIGSFSASACYGPNPAAACNGTNNSTAALVAAALTGSGPSGLNRAGSPVSATASGGSVTVSYGTAGTAGNGIAVTSASQSTQTQWTFSPPSFTSAGTILANGINAGDLNNSPLVTLYTYDALGNLLCVEQHGGVAGSGCPAPSTDPTVPTSLPSPNNWRVRTFTYDSLSRLITANLPEAGTICYGVWSGSPQHCVNGYDADGNILMKTSPAPNQTGFATQSISHCYDELHRETKRDYQSHAYAPPACPITAPTVAYTYDSGTNAVGRLSFLADQAGTAAYTYDALGRVLSETRTIAGSTKGMSYDYTLDGMVLSITYPSGRTVSYAPDSAGRPVSSGDSNGTNYVSTASYNPDNTLKSLVYGGTITQSFLYNPRLQLCRATAYSSGSVPSSCIDPSVHGNIVDRGYEFHAGNGTSGSGTDNGNVISITNYRNTSRSQAFTYDALNRITAASSSANTGSLSWGETYSIDAWGNLMISPMGGKANGGTFQCSGDTSNHATCLGYDSAGNVTAHTSQGQYVYDPENRLLSTGGVTYTYDEDNNRVLKSQNNTPVKLYWFMGNMPLAEADGSGNITAEYIYFGTKRTARIDLPANTVHYYVTDHLGSTSVVANPAGTIEEESDYSPFGTEYVVAAGPNTYKFTGKERDGESQLDDMGARFYSKFIGRFLSVDPGHWLLEDPQYFNMYSYTLNNPLRYSDDDGRSAQDRVNTANDLAAKQIPYATGGGHPGNPNANCGLDCSGLVAKVFQSDPDNTLKVSGRAVDENATFKSAGEYSTDPSDAQPGDAIFFANADGSIAHTGIVVEVKDGRIYFVHAPKPGDHVKRSSISIKHPKWGAQRFAGVGRPRGEKPGQHTTGPSAFMRFLEFLFLSAVETSDLPRNAPRPDPEADRKAPKGDICLKTRDGKCIK